MLREVEVEARQEQAVVGLVRSRAPYLLPRDDPVVAVAIGARRDVRQVRAGAGLREQLAPRLVAAKERRQIAILLFLRAVEDDRRPGHAEPGDVERDVRADTGLLLLPHEVLRRAKTAAPELPRPRGRRPPALVELAVPTAGTFEVVRAALGVRLQPRWEVRVEPLAGLDANLRFRR